MKNLALVRAADVYGRIQSALDAFPPMDGEETLAFVERLMADQRGHDAVKVLAYGLTVASAVQWAHDCVSAVLGEIASEKQKGALSTVEAWLHEQTEANRRACFKAAEAAGFDTAAGCVAMAAFGATGSIAPENVPAVPPPEGFAAHMASGAVMLAVVLRPPQDATANLQDFVQRGKLIAVAT